MHVSVTVAVSLCLAMDDPRKIKFECEKCDRVYGTWQGLNQHKQSHLGKSRYHNYCKMDLVIFPSFFIFAK